KQDRFTSKEELNEIAKLQSESKIVSLLEEDKRKNRNDNNSLATKILYNVLFNAEVSSNILLNAKVSSNILLNAESSSNMLLDAKASSNMLLDANASLQSSNKTIQSTSSPSNLAPILHIHLEEINKWFQIGKSSKNNISIYDYLRLLRLS
ncbi:365_t:CDS:2, partial [Dentiscutata erythropus]